MCFTHHQIVNFLFSINIFCDFCGKKFSANCHNFPRMMVWLRLRSATGRQLSVHIISLKLVRETKIFDF